MTEITRIVVKKIFHLPEVFEDVDGFIFVFVFFLFLKMESELQCFAVVILKTRFCFFEERKAILFLSIRIIYLPYKNHM